MFKLDESHILKNLCAVIMAHTDARYSYLIMEMLSCRLRLVTLVNIRRF